MKRILRAVPTIILCLSATTLSAEVKTEEKSQMQFEGMLGRMMGLFGGRGAKEGLVNTVAVKGSRKMTINDNTGHLVDLDEEKIYEIDMRGKTYKVLTFEELRRRMQEAQEKAKKQSAEATKTEPGEQNVEIDFDLKESGQKKAINGYDCREVVMTITVRQKGKTLEQGGGMVLTSNTWLGPRIAAMKEIAEFDRRYAEKMQFASMFGGSAEQFAMAMAMYPGMKQAMGKFQAENVNMDGTPILTVMRMEAAQNPEQAQQQQRSQAREESTDVTSVRGVLGGLGRKMARKKAESAKTESSDASPGRATIFTVNHELIKVSGNVAASDVAIPAGFKEKR